jgi:predicted AAA+ superfamily ATPase
VLDEAQRIKNVDLTLKLIVDNMPGRQLLVTGSSALELADTINEPLTGRKWEYRLYPVSWGELSGFETMARALLRLPNLLVYGMYPEVLVQQGSEKEVLANLSSSYLYKDLLGFQGIRKPELLGKILQALAWQVGAEVSLNELSRTVQADKNTVAHYIDLLEKAFIIYRLQPFTRNLRTEISSRKIFFYDNGIRNAIIGNYSPVTSRNDVGALWENFLISERLKLLRYNGFYGHTYFWRTTQQQEIDYIEEIDGKIYAFEFKWNPGAKTKFATTFVETYKPTETKVIHRDNFWEWLQTYNY